MTEKKLDEILFELKGLKPKIDLILEELVAKKPEPKKELNNTMKEEFEQDFSKVTIMNQSDLALLVVKNGYQQWLAKSLVKDKLELGYQNGNMYDVEILETSPKSGKATKWVFKKWEKFKVVKN